MTPSPGAADTWMSSYRLPLVGFVLPLVNGDLQAAEDVVQETMLRGWLATRRGIEPRTRAVVAAYGGPQHGHLELPSPPAGGSVAVRVVRGGPWSRRAWPPSPVLSPGSGWRPHRPVRGRPRSRSPAPTRHCTWAPRQPSRRRPGAPASSCG